MTTLPTTHDQFHMLVKDDKRLIQFLIDYKICKKNSICINKQCKFKKRNVLTMFNARLYYKCKNYKCCRRWSPQLNVFKHLQYSQLSIKDILTIIWYWSCDFSVKNTARHAEIDQKTASKWFRRIRTYLYLLLLEAPPMGGAGYEIQIDESLFRGRRKYNRGRFKTGDEKTTETVREKLLAIISGNKSRRNYGNRVDGPWVFGMVLQKKSDLEERQKIRENNENVTKAFIQKLYPTSKEKRKELYRDNRKLHNRRANQATHSSYLKSLIKTSLDNSHEFRMFVVQKRDAKTLIPLIKRHCIENSDIHSDEWRAYSKLNKNGFQHFTVNHKENFVNPDTGKHTQLVESLWRVNKKQISNRIRDKSIENLKLYLGQQWFKSINNKEPHLLFLKVIEVLNALSYNDVIEKIKKISVYCLIFF
jgi:hypothetical protein